MKNNKRSEWVNSKISFIKKRLQDERLKKNIQQAIPFWLASLFTGLIAVLYTRLFNQAESFLSGVLHWHDWAIFIVAPLSFLAGWYIVQRFAPNARGSGIPQVMAAIDLTSQQDGKKVSRLLSLRIIAAKIASSLFVVFGGGAIGREGPTIQIAGSVFQTVYKYMPHNWPRTTHANFILTGAAAGLAAAFNTPLGGIVFAIEELARIHITYFRTALFTAVIIAGLTAQSFLGPYLYLGYPDVKDLHPLIFVAVIVVAVIAGLLGGGMGKLILRVIKWKQSLSRTSTIMYVICSGLLVATIAYFIDEHVLGSGKELMNQTLFTNDKNVSAQTTIFRIIGPIVAFNTGAAGGVFAPSLAAGASVGAFISGIIGFIGSNANILILSGMVAFLTGVTRTPFTSAILVLEMTDRHSVIFHLMLAALIANFAAILISKHSLYEELKKQYLSDSDKNQSTITNPG